MKNDEEDDYMRTSMNLQKSIHGVSQKVGGMENKLKEFQDSLKTLKENEKKKKSSGLDALL